MKNYRITIEPLNPEHAEHADVIEADGFFLGSRLDDEHISVNLCHMNRMTMAAIIKSDKFTIEAAEMAVAPEKAAARILERMLGGDDDDESADE